MTAEHKELLQEFQEFAKTAGTATALMLHVAQRLHDGFPHAAKPLTAGYTAYSRHSGSGVRSPS